MEKRGKKNMTLYSRPENSRKNLAPLNLPPGGGTPYMKGLGMLIIFSRKGLLGLHSKKYFKIIYFQFVLFTRFM